MPIIDRPASLTALAWNPATLPPVGELPVGQVQKDWATDSPGP